MVARKDKVENEDIVIWATFGLTHNPRVEDWPVMPVEIHELKLRPGDFFTENPGIDLPTKKNESSVLTNGNGECCATNGHTNGHSNGTNGMNGQGGLVERVRETLGI